MDSLFEVEWDKILLPSKPLLEIIFRGSAVYLSLVIMLRIVIKREVGSLGLTDLLAIVLLADAAQNAMAGDYQSVADGLILVGTIIGWSYILDWLAFRYDFFRKLLKPPQLMLVKEGRLLRRHLQKEMITEEELMSEIRNHGVAHLDEVQEAYIEPDGMISVITYNRNSERESTSKRKLF